MAELPEGHERRAAFMRWGALAAVGAVLLVWMGYAGLFDTRLEGAALARAVAGEVALNHTKSLRPDVLTGSFDELGLDRLDFEPRMPLRLADIGLVLEGARYCSIQGQIAAQLVLRDEAGTRLTLYQTRLSPGLTSVPDAELSLDGARVELWTEGDLLLGLAR